MLLDSVREVKNALLRSLVRPMASCLAASRPKTLAEARKEETVVGRRLVALGVSRKGQRGYQLAVRLQARTLAGETLVAEIAAAARSEVEVRYVGAVDKLAAPWTQQEHRPLRAGTSVGHHRITAGTLGAFAEGADGKGRFILSNNHVLADENRGKRGDAILQPGSADGGLAADRVARLERFVRLVKGRPNLADAALAALDDGMETAGNAWRGLGRLAGVRSGLPLLGQEVAKLGRTTGVTRGRVTAIELDGLVVGFDGGNLVFDDQLEIESAGSGAFSGGGDSGSLILDAERFAVGLLFAGSGTGGANGRGLTFANPIETVLAALRARLPT
jgi:hypothetical protein